MTERRTPKGLLLSDDEIDVLPHAVEANDDDDVAVGQKRCRGGWRWGRGPAGVVQVGIDPELRAAEIAHDQ